MKIISKITENPKTGSAKVTIKVKGGIYPWGERLRPPLYLSSYGYELRPYYLWQERCAEGVLEKNVTNKLEKIFQYNHGGMLSAIDWYIETMSKLCDEFEKFQNFLSEMDKRHGKKT